MSLFKLFKKHYCHKEFPVGMTCQSKTLDGQCLFPEGCSYAKSDPLLKTRRPTRSKESEDGEWEEV